MAVTAAVVGAAAAAASAGTGIASAAGAFGHKGGGGGGALPLPAPVDTTQQTKALIPGASANAAARSGGGISPEFLAGMIGNETGDQSGAMDVIGDIRKSLGQQS